MPSSPSKCVVLVPVRDAVSMQCEWGLQQLVQRGYEIRRAVGLSAIDFGRCWLAAEALHDGFDEIMWIDADMAFDPNDVDKLRGMGFLLCPGCTRKKMERNSRQRSSRTVEPSTCISAQRAACGKFSTAASGSSSRGGNCLTRSKASATCSRAISGLAVQCGRGFSRHLFPMVTAIGICRRFRVLSSCSKSGVHAPGRHVDPARTCRHLCVYMGGRRTGVQGRGSGRQS